MPAIDPWKDLSVPDVCDMGDCERVQSCVGRNEDGDCPDGHCDMNEDNGCPPCEECPKKNVKPRPTPITAVHFTEFMPPRGERVPRTLELEDPDGTIASDVELILAQGVSFEAEILRVGGLVSLTITDPVNGDLFSELVPNGPKIPIAVTTMIRRAATAARNDEWPSPEEAE